MSERTDLPRTGFASSEQLAGRLRIAIRARTLCALLLVDLDRFGDFNRRFGRARGDRAVRRLMDAVRAWARRSEALIAAEAHDTFSALIERAGPERGIREALILQRASACAVGSRREQCTVSVGVALAPNEGTSAARLRARAESALERARADGGDAVGVAIARTAVSVHAGERAEVARALSLIRDRSNRQGPRRNARALSAQTRPPLERRRTLRPTRRTHARRRG